MLFSSHIPGPPIAEFVERFWMCSDNPLHSRERILPSGTVELVINLKDDEIRIYDPSHLDSYKRFPGSIISGTYTSAFVIDPLQHSSMIGVHFKPGGAFRFLGSVVSELTNTHISLEVVWGRYAHELRERLCVAPTSKQRFTILEKSLTSRLLAKSEHHPAVPIALDLLDNSEAVQTVRGVAQRVGLSQRRFIQVFTEQVGLTPKTFSRVLRFQKVRMLASRTAKPDWLNVALDCAYFDQSHMIRDFLQFAGMKPSDYLRLRSEHVLMNHVPVID
jgi:AraC-like DNA-binding protein